jgi:hypothetical protein
MKSKL